MTDAKLDVRVYPLDDPKGNTKAFASVAVNDIVAIRGVRVVEDKKGLFVSMPQSKDRKTGRWNDTAYPSNSDLRKQITKTVLGEYHRQAELAPEQRGYEKPAEKPENNINVEDIKLDIRVYPIADPQGTTKAFAGVTVDDLVTIRGIRVVEGEEGLFVAMPQNQDKYMNYHAVAFPLTAELHEEISARVLDEFEPPEMVAERKPTLTERLAEGAERSAAHTAPAIAAKSRAGVLE